jgi:hypothetical protein
VGAFPVVRPPGMTEHRDPPAPFLSTVDPRYQSLVSAGTAILWTADPHGNFVEPQPPWISYTGQDWEAHRGAGWLNAAASGITPVRATGIS